MLRAVLSLFSKCTLLLGGGGKVDKRAFDFAEYTRMAMSSETSTVALPKSSACDQLTLNGFPY